jgi:hypothetical protein
MKAVYHVGGAAASAKKLRLYPTSACAQGQEKSESLCWQKESVSSKTDKGKNPL